LALDFTDNYIFPLEANLDSAEHTQRFKDEKPRYEQLTHKLRNLLQDLLTNEGVIAVIESRTKSMESFNEKFVRPGKTYQDPLQEITDLSGLRIIVQTVDEVSKVGLLIERAFSIDGERSVKKSEHLNADQFGYLSEHYIVQLKEPRRLLREWEGLGELNAEIQVRTILQHAWAAVQHSLDYKNAYDIPKPLRRRLFRLSALFELADEELDQISTDVRMLVAKYAEQVQSDDSDIEINVDSLKAYLENSETVTEWASYIESLGVEIGTIGMLSRDVEMARIAGLSTIREIDDLLKTAFSWGKPYLQAFYHNTFGAIIPKGRCSSDRNGILTVFLIANFLEVFTDNVLDLQLGFGLPERATVPARLYNPNAANNNGQS
jgi:putative GTP pyrophosphokinase